MRVMILDDNELRHHGFAIHFKDNELFHARTYSEAQRIMEEQHACFKDIEMVCLDHDLDEENPAADRFKNEQGETIFYNGLHFAKWLNEKNLCPSKVLVHSWNGEGARDMGDELRKNPVVRMLSVRPYRAPVSNS